jgi:hypothetical protein
MHDNMQQQAQRPQPQDPAEVWWGSAAGQRQVHMPVSEPPVEETWRWGYSAWVGITYGPIPVGLLIGLPILIALKLA